MIRDLMEWLDSVGTMTIAATFAGMCIVCWIIARVGARPKTHDEQVAERRERTRREVNLEIERQARAARRAHQSH